MSNSLAKLVGHAGPAIGNGPPVLSDAFRERLGRAADPILELLHLRNGFLAFDGALHVLSAPGISPSSDFETWNSPELWKRHYSGSADELFAFAQDLFGFQYCVSKEGVILFDPETGGHDHFAPTLLEWAEKILADPDVHTGCRIAKLWRATKGPIHVGERFVPAVPFVLGGEFNASNLVLMEATRAMNYYGELAAQIRDLPDGAQVRLTVTD
jgi:hypothetical protein